MAMSMGTKYQPCSPEIWGGIECTINRVGNEFRDQLSYAGHYLRTDDIEKIASLGIKALRYPVLWEYHQPNENTKIDWSWAEQQLNAIKQQNIIPIAGLVHHGSGPSYTDLLDERFPEKLASYAFLVAKQFPWLEYYTPVNEPLTTSRFSGLYGLWYPHKKDAYSCMMMLLNQLKGTVLAMKAIRCVNPDAKLVQTEDLAKVHSTRAMRYQAKFENERRWLTYDLLCGKVNKQHALWNHLMEIGIPASTLDFFLKHPCPPDIMGLNYYVTSERFLDEHIQHYPAHTHGGNSRHVYADVEAVRVKKQAGIKKLLTEAWQRYGIPISVTEVHLNCTREEQLRWFNEVWTQCCKAKQAGIDIKAITAWSLLGSHDWNSLLTQQNNHYEIGVFDTRNNQLRPTATAKLVQSLAMQGMYQHPLLQQKGWWHRQERFLPHIKQNAMKENMLSAAPILVIGKTGTLGAAFARICQQRHLPFIALCRKQLNILNTVQIEKAIEQYRPWAIVNATGYVKVDEAESDMEQCFAVNAHAPSIMAAICKKHGVQFMSFSSDLVFGGDKFVPYVEADKTFPLNVYGKSKAKGESLVMAANPSALIVRTSAFFGPWDQYNFAHHILWSLQQQQTCYAINDITVSPTYVPDLVNASLDLLIDEAAGIWHVSNNGHLTWADFAGELAARAGFTKNKILAKCSTEMKQQAARPAYSVLQSGKGIHLPSFNNALDRYFHEKIY
jgi:dTDP-4-dehydrorhamnose reductase